MPAIEPDVTSCAKCGGKKQTWHGYSQVIFDMRTGLTRDRQFFVGVCDTCDTMRGEVPAEEAEAVISNGSSFVTIVGKKEPEKKKRAKRSRKMAEKEEPIELQIYPSGRQIKQISAIGVENTINTQCDGAVVALCEDGSLWLMSLFQTPTPKGTKLEWTRLPAVPTEEQRSDG